MTQIILYNKTLYSIEDLLGDIRPHLDPVDVSAISSAYDIAKNVHEFQLRPDATPYFWHISRVARIILRELNYIKRDILCAALLHDVLEDSDILNSDVITYNFGPVVAHMVEVLTKNIKLAGKEKDQEEERYIKCLEGADLETKIIKFSERLDNFRCLEFGVKRNPFAYIEETEKLYYPIAEEENSPLLDTLIDEMKKISRKLMD